MLLSTARATSFTQRTNISGPRIDPRGTPYDKMADSEFPLPMIDPEAKI